LSRRCLAPLFFPPLLVSLARVSLTCFCTSSSLTLVLRVGFRRLWVGFSLPGAKVAAPFSISIFSFLIRLRFLLEGSSTGSDFAFFCSSTVSFFSSLTLCSFICH
jgi:hypothetical protein